VAQLLPSEPSARLKSSDTVVPLAPLALADGDEDGELLGDALGEAETLALTLLETLELLELEGELEKGKSYIFLANHFSYLDVAMMGFVPGDAVFVGKASIRKVPFFGYYFKNLHIAVDRNRVKSRAETMRRAGLALDRGSSMVLFPEGGIYTQDPPNLVPFKNGAFRLALEKQLPIIPVTLSYNHVILADQKELILKRTPAKMVLHQALHPSEFDSEDSLKQRCFEVIQEQLLQDNPITRSEHVSSAGSSPSFQTYEN
jgi:1-acyl-sn-glycerol-3-phosphate acyltransferase